MKKERRMVNWKMIIIIIAVFLLIQWLFIGYRYSFGLFKKLGDIRMRNIPGNAAEYSMDKLEVLE